MHALPLLQEKVSFSLVIPTVNRKSELRRLLESLRMQSYRDFQVLLADQNEEGYLADVLAEFSDLDLVVRRMPSKGVSLARNAMLPLAHGDIIAFPDDDCWYAPDTLERVAAAFARHGDAGGVLGIWASDPAGLGRNRLKDGEVTVTQCFVRGETYVQFYRKEAVSAAGGFDPELGPGTGLPYGCGEDTDFLLRVLFQHRKVYRDCSVHLFHPDPLGKAPVNSKIEGYAAGRMYLLRKHDFPLWFRLATVLYPLMRLPVDALRLAKEAVRYRWHMFSSRLRHL